jgi:hypothetical protein
VPIQISVTVKGPKGFGDGPDVEVVKAVDWIPGETLEQLVSRLLYYKVQVAGSPKVGFRWGFCRDYAAEEQVIEIRLVKEVL